MGEAACDLLEAELRLDRLEAELAAELPAHVRAFAAAHAEGRPNPPAPAVARRTGSLAIARLALAHPLLADRAAGVLRLLAPIAIDDDPRVLAARAGEPTWEALAALTAARDAAARERFGLGFVALIHRLHGAEAGMLSGADGSASTDASAPPLAWPARLDAWHAPEPGAAPIARAAVEELGRALAACHGARGRIELVAARGDARPRTFVVEPGRHVIVVAPGVLATPADRFAALHELGHALVGLLAPAGVPRAVDEAAAAYIARLLEDPASLPAGWPSEHADAARARRTQIARALAAIERALAAGTPAPRPTPRPPWALWHDPGAQAAYVAAESLADRWWRELGPRPVPGALATAIRAARAQVDRRDLGIV